MSTGIEIKKKIAAKEEGVTITTDLNSLNFVGAGVNASALGEEVTVTVPGSIGSTAYYLNQTVTQSPYKEFTSVPTTAAEQDTATTIASGATAVIGAYQTPAGVPNTTSIPAGLWQFFLHLYSNVASDDWDVYVEVYKRDLGGIETLLFTTDLESVTNMSTSTTMYLLDGVFPTTSLLTTDRIVVKVLATNMGPGSQTIHMVTEGSAHYSVGTTTLNQVVGAGSVTSVTGTAPIASSGGTTPAISISQATTATDGYLTSTDWNTFNGKQNALTLTTTGTSGAATLVGSTLNIPQYAGGLTYFTEAQNTAAPNATVNVDSLTAVASTTNADFAVNPKGTGALLAQVPNGTATGGNKRGQYAVDWQRTRDHQDRVASGNYATIIGGSHNTASNSYAIAGGFFSNAAGPSSLALINASATNTGAIAIGSNVTASGGGSIAMGSNATQATGDYSVALGYGNSATQQGSFAFGIGSSATGFRSGVMGSDGRTFGISARLVWSGQQQGTAGDTQKSTFILQKRTTNNTPTTLASDSSAAGSANQVILQNQSVYRFKGTIVGKVSGTTGTSAWDIDGLIVRGANAASTTLLVGNVNVIYDGIVVDGPPTLAADTTNGGLRVQVIGSLANIQWTAVIETTEVIYA